MQAQIAELTDRLNRNSSNSSQPPSSDPLWKSILGKKPTGRKPGGQPGHTGHFRELAPLERVKEVKTYIPAVCESCNAPLPKEAQPNDPEPTRFQVSELPPVLVEITEHQGHARTCLCCKTVTRAEIPADILAHTTGPRLTATLSYLSGHCHIGKRNIQEVSATIFGTPVSLGLVANLEQEMSAALEVPHAEALEAVRAAPVKNVDETGWAKGGKLQWLWLAATASVVGIKIHAKRGKEGLHALLGDMISGIITSDRWSAYAKLPLNMRQLCWAHLKRDFQRLFEMGDGTKEIGEAGLGTVKELFTLWRDFKERRIDRPELQWRLKPVQERLEMALLRGRDGSDKMTQRFCRRLLKVYDGLWTFASVEGVEPTNNHAERMVRPAVLWRKQSFGNHSEEGCRFTERILTAVQTLRLQKRAVVDYLYRALAASRAKAPAPALLTG